MDMEHHVTGHIMDGGVGLQGIVIKEAKGMKVCVISRLGLVGGQRAEGDKHGGVYCNGLVEQHNDDLL